MTPEDQLKIYGQLLTGEETNLDLSKLLRVTYLKGKLRRLLDLIPFGDAKDNLTDLTKGVLLGWAIQQGIVTDAGIITRFQAAVTAQLEFYGGAEYVMGTLESNAVKLSDLMSRYYQAKVAIAAAADIEAVGSADVEDSVLSPDQD
jgi:hypothetical protein